MDDTMFVAKHQLHSALESLRDSPEEAPNEERAGSSVLFVCRATALPDDCVLSFPAGSTCSYRSLLAGGFLGALSSYSD